MVKTLRGNLIKLFKVTIVLMLCGSCSTTTTVIDTIDDIECRIYFSKTFQNNVKIKLYRCLNSGLTLETNFFDF